MTNKITQHRQSRSLELHHASLVIDMHSDAHLDVIRARGRGETRVLERRHLPLWLKSAQDVERLKYILRAPEDETGLARMRFQLREAKRIADNLQIPIAAAVGRGLTGMQQLAGSSELCMMMIENPDIVHAYLEHEHQVNLKMLDIAADLGVDYVVRNGFYETADFYSPTMLS